MNIRLIYIVYIVGALIIVSTGIAIFAFFHPFQISAVDESNKLSPDINYSAYSNSTSSSNSSTSSSSIAPSFTLPSTIGSKISLSDYAGKKNVLLYFQEGIMCSPCWIQLEDIQKEYDKFESLDIEVLTITVDPLNALIKESNKRGITLPVLDDGNLTVSKAYNVLDYSMHPGSRPGHSFVLIGKDGNIVWKKDYYPSALSSDAMNMNGMNMNIEGRMNVPVDELLDEIYKVAYRLYPDSSSRTTVTTTSSKINVNDSDYYSRAQRNNAFSTQATTIVDHSMCLTSIHKHADFKVYLNENPLNLSQRKYMDQSMDVHFHPTVKVKPDDIPGMPFADIVHIHKENVTIRDFTNTLDFDPNTLKMLSDERQMLKVYANGDLQNDGLDYVIQDKDRILVSYGSDEKTENQTISKQIESVTSYASIGKDKNPSVFGGC